MIRTISKHLISELQLKNFLTRSSLTLRCLSTRQHRKLTKIEYCEPHIFPYEEGPIVKSPFDDVIIPKLTVEQYVWNNYQQWENKVAIVCGVTGRSYTYAKLRDHSAAFAIQLQQKFKLQPRDVLGICLPNIPEYPIAALGASEAGLIISTFNPIYTAEEIARQIVDSNTKVIIGFSNNYNVICEAIKLVKRPIPIISVKLTNDDMTPPGAINFDELINLDNIDFSKLKEHNTDIDEISVLPYSSGTTGLPKGVMLSHKNIVSNCEMIEFKINGESFSKPTTDSFQESLICVLPLYHIYGWVVTLISKLARGCKHVTLPKFHPELFINTLADHKISLIHLVPPIVIFLGHCDKLENKHVENVRCIMSGAAPCGPPDAERLLKKFNKSVFFQGYGMTETSPVVLMNRTRYDRLESVGCLTSTTQAKIVNIDDKTNYPLGPNKVGELLVRGPQVMKGYLNRKDATDEILIENGWMRTGDMAFYTEDGFFQITERLKELIKVKGFQVPPAELEQILREHPKILEAGVIGISHPISGEVPKAFVVLKPGQQATEKEIQDFVAAKVASYKKLEGGVMFIDQLPKSASGKILRRTLRDEYVKDK